MGRGRRKPIFLESLKLTGAGAKGKAVGRTDEGQVVFVQNAVPGDVVDVRVTRKKSAFLEGRATRIVEESPFRVEAVCAHFDYCGGCKWQNLDYAKQLEFKDEEVRNNLQRLGHVEVDEYLPILGCDEPYFYRNKLEFSFSNKRWLTPEEIQSDAGVHSKAGLGFHIPGMWDKVLDIEKCYLQTEPSNAIRNFVRRFALENNLSFYDLREQSGLLRTLMIRSTTTGEVMVVIQFHDDDQKAREKLMAAMVAEFPSITSLMYTINQKGNDSLYDCDVQLFHGRDYICEEMPGFAASDKPLSFRIGPKSFYQTNPKQAHALYKQALEFADIREGDLVYDLYTGTGTIACFLARKASRVVGVESVPEAIDAARQNAEANGLSNIDFVVGDMKELFTDAFADRFGKPDVVICDPPRDGMHAKVVEQLLEVAARRIVYVSCNSATQARDLERLQNKYRVTRSRAVDMFPQTHHIENIVVLDLKMD